MYEGMKEWKNRKKLSIQRWKADTIWLCLFKENKNKKNEWRGFA